MPFQPSVGSQTSKLTAGCVVAATRQKPGSSSAWFAPGGVNAPAGTVSARVMVVLANVTPVRVSQAIGPDTSAVPDAAVVVAASPEPHAATVAIVTAVAADQKRVVHRSVVVFCMSLILYVGPVSSKCGVARVAHRFSRSAGLKACATRLARNLVPCNRDSQHKSPAGHHACMRCSAVTNAQFAPLSRLFTRAPHYRLMQRHFHHGLLGTQRGHRASLQHLLHRAMCFENSGVGVRAGGRVRVGDRNLPERLSADHARSGIAR